MALIEKRGPSRTELKWFGLMFAGFFGLLGALALLKSRQAFAVGLWSIGATGAVVYYALRPIREPFYRLWLATFYPLGWVVSHAMIAIVFFGVLTPIGLLMRLLGRDPMQRRFEPSAATYWIAHDPGGDPARYFKQF